MLLKCFLLTSFLVWGLENTSTSFLLHKVYKVTKVKQMKNILE